MDVSTNDLIVISVIAKNDIPFASYDLLQAIAATKRVDNKSFRIVIVLRI